METINTNAYDRNAKRILSNKSLLSGVLKELIPEYNNLEKSEIEKLLDDKDDRYVTCLPLKDENDNGIVEYDVLFTPRLPNTNDRIGIYIDIEIQNRSSGKHLFKRAKYYMSRLITRQKNETFDHDDYSNLKDVYSIWVCVNPPKKYRNTIIKYSLKGDLLKSIKPVKLNDNDKSSIIFINLDRMEADFSETLSILNILFKKQDVSLIPETLSSRYNIDVSSKEVIELSNFEASSYYAGVDDGMKKGKIEAILNLIKSGLDKDLLLSSSGLSDDLIERINKILEEEK